MDSFRTNFAGDTSTLYANTGRGESVASGGGTFVDEVRGGGSYYAQNDFRLHFGLGDETAVTRVVMRWANGVEEAFAAAAVDRLITLTEGRGTKAGGPGR